MSAFHNTEEAESLAEKWHEFGLIVSLLGVIVAVGGAGWHYFAIQEHRAHIKELRGDK